MVHASSPQSTTAPAGRRALRWSLILLTLISVGALLTFPLLPEGPGTAGPGGPPSPSTDGPSSTPDDAPTATDPTPDNPSDGPTDPGGPTPSDPPSAAPSNPPSSNAPPDAPGPAADGELDEDSATEVISTAIETPLDSADTADALDVALADIAVEGYAAELESQWLELTSQGWSQTGSPQVESLEIISLETESDPVAAQVVACIDSSDVITVDASGAPIGDSSATSPRALHHFTMVQGEDGIWRISSHSFPDDPSC